MREHPQRYALNNELHARPHLDVEGPARASYFVFLRDEDDAGDFAHLLVLCRRYGLAEPPPRSKHYTVTTETFTLKWEAHTEFTSYLFVREGAATPFTERVIDRVPQDWWQATPGELLLASHVEFCGVERAEPGERELQDWFGASSLCVSTVRQGSATVWMDFRIHEDGAARVLVRNVLMTPSQAGRLLQRLVELDTYRALALLSLPLAQRTSPRIREVDLALAGLTARLGDLRGLDDQRAALGGLTALSGQIESVAATTAYRFGATLAYHALVRERLELVREAQDPGRPSIAEFVERRLLPAIRTCESVQSRCEGIARRLTRSGNLLRTQVDVAVEAQNRDLLASMNQRTRMQLRLQETVEGLSIAAITYYVVGLVGYVAKWIHGWMPGLSVEFTQAAAIPVTAVLLWKTLKHAKAGLHRDDAAGP